MVVHITKKDEQETADLVRRRLSSLAPEFEKYGIKDPKAILNLEVGFALVFLKYNGQPLRLDSYQFGMMVNRYKDRCVNKSRQVGFSFTIAVESLVRAHLRKKHSSVCVSYNLDDAKEKITLARELHESLPLGIQRKIVTDKKTELAFKSNTGNKSVTRMVSFPSKAPRGKHGDIYLDELAHCANDNEIYTGATANTVRVAGQVTIGSTPLGQSGKFHDIFTAKTRSYKSYQRYEVPWWLCDHLCKDVRLAVYGDPKRGLPKAADMKTEDRVYLYGTRALKGQYEKLDLEGFQQEFELAFHDERSSFFPYEIIIPVCNKEKYEVPCFDSVEEVVDQAPKLGKLYLGFDVGHSTHPSELVLVDYKRGKYTARYREQFKNWKFPDQRARLIEIMETLGNNLMEFRIDATGLGINLAEDLARHPEYGYKVKLFKFTNRLKSDMAKRFKVLLETKAVQLYRDRTIVSQIHSIRKKISHHGNEIFDSNESKKHHGDFFWALAMACHDRHEIVKKPGQIGVRTIDLDEEGDEPENSDVSSNPLVEEEVSNPEFPDKIDYREIRTRELLAMARRYLVIEKVWLQSQGLAIAKAYRKEYLSIRDELESRREQRGMGIASI